LTEDQVAATPLRLLAPVLNICGSASLLSPQVFNPQQDRYGLLPAMTRIITGVRLPFAAPRLHRIERAGPGLDRPQGYERTLKGEIEVRDLSFRYGDDEPYVFENLTSA
jgi:hypothetical protein